MLIGRTYCSNDPPKRPAKSLVFLMMNKYLNSNFAREEYQIMANPSVPSENCALDPATGKLKDAADIFFYESETDAVPIPTGRQPIQGAVPVTEGMYQS